MSTSDFVDFCDPWGPRGPDACLNSRTRRHDLGLGVATGGTAPEFALTNVSDPEAPPVSLSSLLRASAKGVFLQFGSYT